jgi:uncharacterized protein YlxP (DUF503 family)
MYVLYGQVQLFLPHASSLKDKRQTIQSIIGRIRKRFCVSICEVDYHDLWQRSTLGYAAVSSSYAEISYISGIIQDTLDQYQDVCEIIDLRNEIIKLTEEKDRLEGTLLSLDLFSMTPLDAINKLYQVQQQLKKNAAGEE